MFTIEVKDEGVHAAISALVGRVANTRPLLQQIGEMVKERSKQRFATGIGPDGVRWKPNARATIEAFLRKRSGEYAKFTNLKTRKQGLSRVGDREGFYKQDGTLDSKSRDLLMGKKPLIGESLDLSRQFHVTSDATSVTIGHSAIYAAIQQFGGTAGKGRKVKIPARPFLPVTESGDLYPAERSAILDTLNDYLAGRGFAK